MKIRLTEKYKPFSHEGGTSLLLPKSSWQATVYPAKIALTNLMTMGREEAMTVTPHLKGPLSQFTVMQDLERKWIRVFGRGSQGFFSYRLFAASSEIVLFLERGPKEGIAFTSAGETKTLRRKEELILPTKFIAFPSATEEKIHCGSKKKQDWNLVKRRLNLNEILPIWFQLGKDIPTHPLLDVGTGQLLIQCHEFLKKRDREKIGPAFLELFKGGFEGILAPHLLDSTFQGLPESGEVPPEASPLMLLGEGARLIRSLFLQIEGSALSILPCLPKELHAGRIVGAPLSKTLTCDLEWSKKLIRRLNFHSTIDQEISLKLQPAIQSYRLRYALKERGSRADASTPLALKKGLTLLDRFQK